MKIRSISYILFGFLCISSAGVFAQDVQWASDLISFSTQSGEIKWSAKQVLGKPNKCPASGESPNAWVGKNDGNIGGGEERLKVGYKKPMQIQQVAIAENLNPGAVEQVILYDVDNVQHRVYFGEPGPVEAKSRVMNVFFQRTVYKVKAVELILQCGKVPGFNQIDAIGISDSKTPVIAAPNVAPNSRIIGEREHLSRNINSPYSEVFPVISPDGKLLFIDRKANPYNFGNNDNIWFSTLQPDGEWGPVQNIGPQLNNGNSAYVASVTPDGNTLLIGGSYYDEVNFRVDFGLWTVNLESYGWGKPQRVRIDNFYNRARFLEFCLAADGKTILLTMQRDDTRGERDIYVSFLKPDGTWSAPKDLGAEINTLDEEATPFLASDGKTLYFSSNGYSGYGLNDMYVSRRLDDSWIHWSEPQNLGPDINTTDWDAYYTVPASGDYGYFVSNKSSYGGEDIFRVKLPESLRPAAVVLVSGKVLDKKTGKPLAAQIRYELLPSGKEIGLARSNPTTGEYKITLPAGANYGFRADTKGYIAVNENLDLTKQKTYGEVNKDLELVPIEVGQTIRLNNIFFDFSKSELKEESFSELDRLVDLIKASPEMEVEISGHTDNVGSDAQNKLLSETRAKAVKAYFVEKGIDTKRLKTVGYGRTKPLASNDTEEGRQQNRRVEFTIEKQ